MVKVCETKMAMTKLYLAGPGAYYPLKSSCLLLSGTCLACLLRVVASSL